VLCAPNDIHTMHVTGKTKELGSHMQNGSGSRLGDDTVLQLRQHNSALHCFSADPFQPASKALLLTLASYSDTIGTDLQCAGAFKKDW